MGSNAFNFSITVGKTCGTLGSGVGDDGGVFWGVIRTGIRGRDGDTLGTDVSDIGNKVDWIGRSSARCRI